MKKDYRRTKATVSMINYHFVFCPRSSGEVVQRDLYSAFLLEYIDTESLEYNTKALNSAFPAFLKMHENTKKRLQEAESYLPASVGF